MCPLTGQGSLTRTAAPYRSEDILAAVGPVLGTVLVDVSLTWTLDTGISSSLLTTWGEGQREKQGYREMEREAQKKRKRETGRKTGIQRDREGDREKEEERDREKKKERDREGDREKEEERETGRENKMERDREKKTERDREGNRDKQTDKLNRHVPATMARDNETVAVNLTKQPKLTLHC